MKPSDHDTLIEIRTKLNDLTAQVRELKDGTFARITSLEKDKADKDVVEQLQKKVNLDVESRVRALENASIINKGEKKGAWALWAIIGGIVAIVATILTLLGALGLLK